MIQLPDGSFRASAKDLNDLAPAPSPAPSVMSADTGAPSSTRPKKDAKRDYNIARSFVLSHPHPLAAYAGEVYELKDETGWQVITPWVIDQLAQALGRQPSGPFSLVLNRLGIPDQAHLDLQSVYWSWSGDKWAGRWEPAPVDRHEVVFSDGIYDSVTAAHRPLPHTLWGPRISLPYNLNYDDEDLVPYQQEFEDMVAYALPDPGVRRHFQEVMSLILQPHFTLRGQIVLWGVPYSCKSTIAKAISVAPAGIRGASFVQEARLVADKWASTLIQGRFVNVSDDSPKTRRWVPFLKEYTSGHMTIEAKGFKPACVVPTAKLISTCNEMQDLQDPSGAATQRLLSFHFTRPRPRSTSSSADQFMSPNYWANEHRRQAVLGWLMQGNTRFHSRRGWDEPAQWQAEQAAAGAQADPVAAEILANIEPDTTSFLATEDIHTRINTRFLSPQALSAYILRMFPSATQARVMVKGRRCHGYRGLRLKE